MTYYTTRVEPDPDVRKSETPQGVPAVNGWFPNIIQGTSKGGPKEVHRGPTNPQGVSTVRPSWTQNDKGIVYQRYTWERQSSTWVPPEETTRFSGVEDPLASGAARETFRTFTRIFNRQAGTDNTRNLDNTVTAKSPYGQQDGVSWTTRVDPVLANPKLTPPSDESSVVRIPPSGPHGLHSRNPMPNKAKTNQNYAAQPQQKAVNQNKLANSTRAGQTYSATTKHLIGNTNPVTYTRGGNRGTR